jgi:RNA polymerase sigma-70 factor (ECF subfamily)
LDGFQTFFNETKGRFLNFLIRLTGDADRAADAFQESYLRYWKRYGQKTPNVRLLFTIGRNIAMDGHRSRRPHQPIDEQRRDERPDPESTVIVKEAYGRVLEALTSLDPAERELLSLAVDGGFRYSQIAEITRMSEANVKVKIHRARQKLRRYLKEA